MQASKLFCLLSPSFGRCCNEHCRLANWVERSGRPTIDRPTRRPCISGEHRLGQGRHPLKGFDLKTGQGKVSAELPGDHTLCNDIAIGADGSAFVTNSVAPQILRLPPGSNQLEVWADDPLLAPPAGGAGLDGIAFGTSGSLYVDTYTPGELFRVDVVDGKAAKVTKLKPSRPLTLSDAIRPLGGNEFLIIEGAGRLDRIRIQGNDAMIETLKDGYAS
jgi:hypothetical protein